MIKSDSTETASLLVARFGAVADGIGMLFSGYVEVIIHDLQSQTVVYIANNISNRQLGDPSALDDVTFDAGEVNFGPYEKCNWDGRNIRSVSTVLRDSDANAIGVLCINLNIAPLEGMQNILEQFLSQANTTAQPEKLFHDDWQERINMFVSNWLSDKKMPLSALNRKGKQELVSALYQSGAFKGKNTPDYVAKILGLGRATVFKYIKTAKSTTVT